MRKIVDGDVGLFVLEFVLRRAIKRRLRAGGTTAPALRALLDEVVAVRSEPIEVVERRVARVRSSRVPRRILK